MTALSILLKEHTNLSQKLKELGIEGELQTLLEKVNLDKNYSWEVEFQQIINQATTSTASLRAPEGYHLPNTMSEFGDLFIKFGGHPSAAGFSAQSDKLSGIKKKFKEYLSKFKPDSSKEKTYLPKAILDKFSPSLQNYAKQPNIIFLQMEDLNADLLKQIYNLEPFGQDFPFPLFLFQVKKEQIFSIKVMGTGKNHLKIALANRLTVTLFNLEQNVIDRVNNWVQEKDMAYANELYLVAKLSQNTWNGNTTLELIGEFMELV